MDKKILIGIPCGSGQMPAIMVQSLLQLRKPLPCAVMIIERRRIDKARNAFCDEAIKGGFDYLFMVDDDNPIPEDTLEKFIEDDKDIVLAPILTRNPSEQGKHVLCAFYSEDLHVGDDVIPLYRNIEHFRDVGPLHRVDAGGTGAILIKVEVLKMLKENYDYLFEFGDIKINDKRRTMSEDCEFSERAVKAGFEIWVDDRVRPVHISGFKTVQYS